MQHEITQKGLLLDEKGNVTTAGWAKKLILDYDREAIKVPAFMIKEWDYYAVLNDQFGIALTVADNGYLGIISVTVLDFTMPYEWTKTTMIPFSLGKFNMPSSSSKGDVVYRGKGMNLSFIKEVGKRTLEVDIDNFHQGKRLRGVISLNENEENDTMVIVTPFHKKKRFYYNQKINCMKASGQVTFGDKIHDFNEHKSFGVLDWGRGVWTYKNTWYWGSASGEIDGELFGFNIGYGFGDTSQASENMIFYKGKCHKLDDVTFHIPEESYTETWKITSSNKRFEMNFEPIIDRSSKANVLILESDQHQVFGYFTGKVVLDDESVIQVNRLLGFAEKVINKW